MSWFIDILMYVWELFKTWLHTLFVTPFQTTDMLWLLVPVWTAWFFAEFFQEKKGTSLGNAISNAVVVMWGSIDCTRQTIQLIGNGVLTGMWDLVGRFLLIAVLFTYGLIIVILGWKGNTLIKKIGRIREVTYVFAMFVPVFYNAIPFSWNHIFATILFFPLFYYLIELIDYYLPNPEAIEIDEGESKSSYSEPSSSSSSLDFPKRL